jgi:hypothetical protein
MLLNKSEAKLIKYGPTCQSNLADGAQSAPLLRRFKAEKKGPPGRIYYQYRNIILRAAMVTIHYQCRNIILRAAMVINVDVEHIKMLPDLKQIPGVVGW